jgi:hypothetical protein
MLDVDDFWLLFSCSPPTSGPGSEKNKQTARVVGDERTHAAVYAQLFRRGVRRNAVEFVMIGDFSQDSRA